MTNLLIFGAMSATGGLALFFVITMSMPVAVIFYLKWDKIENWYKTKQDRKEQKVEGEPSSFKKFINTYFGDGSIVNGEVKTVEDLSKAVGTKSTQQLLAEQRKLEKKKILSDKEKEALEKKNQEKAKEKEQLKKAKESKKTNKSEKKSKPDKPATKKSTSSKPATKKPTTKK